MQCGDAFVACLSVLTRASGWEGRGERRARMCVASGHQRRVGAFRDSVDVASFFFFFGVAQDFYSGCARTGQVDLVALEDYSSSFERKPVAIVLVYSRCVLTTMRVFVATVAKVVARCQARHNGNATQYGRVPCSRFRNRFAYFFL